MAKTRQKHSSTKKRVRQELDSVYLLKLVLYLIVGAQWIRFTDAAGSSQVPVPIGLIVGVLFAAQDHFQIDRKIEYAVLIVAMFIGFWSQIGIYISL